MPRSFWNLLYDHNTNLFFCDNFTALSTTDVRILTSLAELWLIGNTEPPRPLVQMMLKFKSIGSLNNLLPHLERKGVITRPSSSTVAITAAGLQRPQIKALKPPTNNVEHHNNIKSHLNPKQIEIFGVLVDGKVYNRSEVASRLGYVSHKGHFQNTLSGMKGLGIISYPTSNEVQLTDMCFILAPGSMAPELTPASSVAVAFGGATAVRKAQNSAKVIAAKKPSQTKHTLLAGASVAMVPLVTTDPANPDAAYDADTDVESYDKKPAAISNVVPVEPPTASSIDLTHSDEDDEDVDRITTIVLTSSGDESGWDPIAIADAQAAESADGGVFLSV